MGVVDTALERYDFLDPERMGVLGGSYGGYMTSWIVGHTNRFKAALSERAVNHLVSAFGSSDLFWIFERQFGGSMAEQRRDVAADVAGRLCEGHLHAAPVVHSENDLRCDIEQGEHLFTLLRLAGKEVEMLRFPAEGHELSRSGSPSPPRPALRGDPRVVRPPARRQAGWSYAGSSAPGTARPRYQRSQWTIVSSGLRRPGLNSVPIV